MARRSTLMSSLVVLTFLVGAGRAAADPGNGRGQATFPMVCDGELHELTMGAGSWAAADLGHGKFIPKATHFTIHDDGGNLLHEEHDVKNGPKGRSSCVDELEIEGLRYRFVVEGKMKGSS